MPIIINGSPANTKPWKKMPEFGQDAPVPVTINGRKSQALVTRGGMPPKTYSYFTIDGFVYYIPGHIPYGAVIEGTGATPPGSGFDFVDK